MEEAARLREEREEHEVLERFTAEIAAAGQVFDCGANRCTEKGREKRHIEDIRNGATVLEHDERSEKFEADTDAGVAVSRTDTAVSLSHPATKTKTVGQERGASTLAATSLRKIRRKKGNAIDELFRGL